MTDDRILVVPAMWAPNIETFERWPSVRTLLARLRAFLPVDMYQWSSLRGLDREVGWLASARHFAATIRSCHHVLILDNAGGESLLWAIAQAEEQPRSLIITGFLPSPEKLQAMGMKSLAGAMEANRQLAMSNSAQILRIVMQGADEHYLSEELKRLERDVDQDKLRSLLTPGDPDSQREFTLPQPSLFLELAVEVAGHESVEIYKTIVPNTRVQQLEIWPLRLHEEEGGAELAARIVPFIEEVIAARSDC